MNNDKLKIGLYGYFTSLLANLSIGQNGRKGKTLKNHTEITIWSQFKVLADGYLFHKVYFTICK